MKTYCLHLFCFYLLTTSLLLKQKKLKKSIYEVKRFSSEYYPITLDLNAVIQVGLLEVPCDAFGDFFDKQGNHLGTDGINDKKKYIIECLSDVKFIRKNTKAGIYTSVESISCKKLLPSDVVLRESLHVLKRTESKTALDRKGGLHGESAVVMKSGQVIRGISGPAAYVKDGSLYANEVLPPLPAGSNSKDVEATIHYHVTGSIVKNDFIYSPNIILPSATDSSTFSKFDFNVIVGAVKPPRKGIVMLRVLHCT
ncbi:MAG: hypothetical protein ACFB0B_03255 [Thermonemataceae bacterium]